MNSDDLCKLTLSEVAALVRQKKVSPVELTRACLDRIGRLDHELNSFTAIFHEEALTDAGRAETELLRGTDRGPLHGIPVAIKDLIDIAGKPTTAASKLLQNNIATADAEVVKRLREAGAIIVGKNNLHEFAYGGSGVISAYGPVRNPRDKSRITGGSSSGTAAAVAAGLCFAGIGTDTAGSIRLPAACCGVVGLKPAFGRVSVQGVVPLSWSYDHVGPLTRSVNDSAIVLAAISDWRARPASVRELKIGIAREFFFAGLDTDVAAAVESMIDRLEGAVASVTEVSIRVDEDRTVSTYESWQYHQAWVAEKSDLYDPQTLKRIRAGERYTPEQVAAKRLELQRMRKEVGELFRDVDVIVTPTSPIVPPGFAELEANPDLLRPKELMMLRNTRPFNVLGIPAISLPCGDMIGLQIAAMNEETLLAVARGLECQREAVDQ